VQSPEQDRVGSGGSAGLLGRLPELLLGRVPVHRADLEKAI